tara:strand:+ start:132 stop:452 length:321 start_codon:yes stop_codon:yes gene_type:complete
VGTKLAEMRDVCTLEELSNLYELDTLVKGGFTYEQLKGLFGEYLINGYFIKEAIKGTLENAQKLNQEDLISKVLVQDQIKNITDDQDYVGKLIGHLEDEGKIRQNY